MAKKLHIDIETFSSVDIKSCGAYKYVESPDFEILMIAYAFDDGPVQISVCSAVNLPGVWAMDAYLRNALLDPTIEKWAHNANFERIAFRAIGIDVPIEQWRCTAVKSLYCGLPQSLDDVSKALNLEEKGKLSTGKALIRYFSIPCKPTKVNGGRTRNLPHDDPEKWEQFKAYCVGDVEAEREIDHRLAKYDLPGFEWENWFLDQKINDRGVLIDMDVAKNAIAFDEKFAQEVNDRMKEITGLDNPNSLTQLKAWLNDRLDEKVDTLAKGTLDSLIAKAGDGVVAEVLELRKLSSKTSIKKYLAMVNCACADGRAHGLFQFYGASRTGRWAGRLIQLQNMVRNEMKDLNVARATVASGDYEWLRFLYDDITGVLAQLIRTALIASPGSTFGVADFSAIEARVIAWLASEKWRMDVFATHGKIYEESASRMFGVPIEQIGKGSDYRQKGKVAELALGYQGGVGALKTMGGEKMGLSEEEMQTIVTKWRGASPAIVSLWYNVQDCAIAAVKQRRKVVSKFRGLVFDCDAEYFTITLPSGRRLFYREPRLVPGKFGGEALQYKGKDQTTGQWVSLDTYGGKLVENIVQAIARDALAESMRRLDACGFDVVMHVHDEIVCEISAEDEFALDLDFICREMAVPLPWAPDLLLTADGYTTNFYKKD